VLEIITMDQIITDYKLTRRQATRYLNKKGCPLLPRGKGQPYKVIRHKWEEWLVKVVKKEEEMNNLKIFQNEDFGQVRTIEENGKVLFCGSDVAKALGYAKPHNAISTHCKGATLKQGIIDTLGREQSINFIPEGDLYRLIANSKLPSAEKFESWVFDEVLPSIRKHGLYATDELLNNPDLLISLAQELKDERALRNEMQSKIETDRPKVLFADSVSASKTSILVGELAKLLRQNGIEIGQNRLFEKLRSEGYLIRRKGTDWNMPTQYSMDLELFEIKEHSHLDSNGNNITTKTAKVTGKGQIYFINKFIEQAS
jgi:anti-repressor protein